MYKIGVMLGRLTNGFQSDHGTVYHAVIRKMVKHPNAGKVLDNGYVIPEKYETDVSLCGRKPGRKSVGWKFDDPERVVSCEKCLKKIQK